MNHEESRRDILPSRRADVAPPPPAYARPAARDEAPDRAWVTPIAARASAGERLGRTIRRHWWQILPLWALAAGGIWYGLPRWFPNSYEATSEVQVDAGSGSGPKKGEPDFETFKETEARRLTNPTIIKEAVRAAPDLGRGLAEDAKTDPEAAILGGISAAVRPKTDLIQVTLVARHDRGLARIVDEVIGAYLKVANDFSEDGVAERSYKLKNLARAKEAQVKAKQAEVAGLVRKLGSLDADQARGRHAAAIEQRAGLSDQLLKTDLEVVELQATLEAARREEAAQAARPQPSRERTEKEAARSFYLVPEVAALSERRDDLDRKLVVAAREPAKAAGEAGRKALQARRDDLDRQINELWLKLKPALMVAAQDDAGPRAASESSRLEGRIDALRARQKMLNERLEAMNRETLAGGSEVLALEFARQDLARSEKVLGLMTDTLGQAEVESSAPPARFQKLYPARTVERTQDLPRWALGVLGPAAVLLGLLGFFGMVEQRAGRILDPADLPARAGLNVIGLVPPLPRGRARLGGVGAPVGRRSQADVERFIQSLDQLRVIVCGRGDAQGRPRRSLLITSASQGEGKSTLAAQLAERSVNAGLLTLLVDADLRNPTLSRMFDRPESVGLANVLRGELLAEEAIGTVPEAGGFHFLSAGLVRDDLSRLLGSERLARFLESARESFDLVLIDSPPVLPVADALTIGRWVDGAILTVRPKVSRLPMVERATQQLASVGVAVLGAVVSGVKDRHAPYYGPRPTADAGNPAGEP